LLLRSTASHFEQTSPNRALFLLNLYASFISSGCSAHGKTHKATERLAQVRNNNGLHAADLVRERDQSGAIVEHRVRKSAYVRELLHAAKKLADELYAAAEQFRKDFERAQLDLGKEKTVHLSFRNGS
jgi:Xaa-Pro aminopeptidase